MPALCRLEACTTNAGSHSLRLWCGRLACTESVETPCTAADSSKHCRPGSLPHHRLRQLLSPLHLHCELTLCSVSAHRGLWE